MSAHEGSEECSQANELGYVVKNEGESEVIINT